MAQAKDDFTPLKTWYLEPQGDVQFTGPIVLLTCDAVFSGGEVFALAIKQLPYVTIIGDHTNGIFSYQLERHYPMAGSTACRTRSTCRLTWCATKA